MGETVGTGDLLSLLGSDSYVHQRAWLRVRKNEVVQVWNSRAETGVWDLYSCQRNGVLVYAVLDEREKDCEPVGEPFAKDTQVLGQVRGSKRTPTHSGGKRR